MNKLRQLDLNLLLVLYVLLEEKHVSRAAKRLHKSQPAVSHALSQLRTFFADPLLFRQHGRMTLTATAQSLHTPLGELLGGLDELLGGTEFDPASHKQNIRLAMSDYASRVVLPKIVRRLRHTAPNIRLLVNQPSSRAHLLAQLASGEIDMAFGVFENLPAEVCRQTLFDEHFVCMTDKQNLPNYQTLRLADWAKLPHISLSLQADSREEIANHLQKSGLKWRSVIALPHWNAALALLVHSDLLLTVSSRMADDLSAYPTLATFAPPADLPTVAYLMLWHERKQTDKALAWFRQLVVGSVGD
ncbi:LysR family transcriptional regulator [Conservatibacter flavescens]|uniref:LysR family transcriptional regulator n=1 Tax=Conservatibacter flavescens TaxID=28161 RepID=A0A2M8S5E8_9PAST|nr:LysR family transcriptional regulator [Conservatibacter flavescens]PJG86354.1 LysR family transcriptional regulator [Conservatibacter flavescens]